MPTPSLHDQITVIRASLGSTIRTSKHSKSAIRGRFHNRSVIRHFCKIRESIQFFNKIRESVAILGQIRRSASLFTPLPPTHNNSVSNFATGFTKQIILHLWRKKCLRCSFETGLIVKCKPSLSSAFPLERSRSSCKGKFIV